MRNSYGVAGTSPACLSNHSYSKVNTRCDHRISLSNAVCPHSFGILSSVHVYTAMAAETIPVSERPGMKSFEVPNVLSPPPLRIHVDVDDWGKFCLKIEIVS